MRATGFALAAATVLLLSGPPAMAIAPPNDSFAGALSVGVGQEYTGSVADATAELGEPSHHPGGPYRSVWFRFRAAHTARMTVDTGGSAFDTVLAAYRGSAISGLRSIAADDDSSPTGSGSTIRFVARRGVTYSFAIDSYGRGLPEEPVYKLWVSDGSIAGKGVSVVVGSGQTVQSVRSRGLSTVVTARRKAKIRVALTVGRAQARRLGLGSRALGSVSGWVDYGDQMPAVIRVTPAAARALRGRATLTASVRTTILQSRAPNRVSTQRVTLPN